MKYLKYDTKKLKITQSIFDKRYTAKTESIFALGNGYLGLRSADEEIETFNTPNLFVNGLFNKDNNDEVPELANLADVIQNQILFDDQPFSIQKSDKYSKVLDFKNGILFRNILLNREKNKIKINFERFVSQENLNIYAQKITISFSNELKNQELSVNLIPQINGQVTNSGTQHFKEGEKFRTTSNSIRMLQETTHSNIFSVHNLVTKLYVNGKEINGGGDDYSVDVKRRKILFNIKTKIKPGDVLVLEKLISINTTIDKDERISKTEAMEKADKLLSVLKNSTYSELLENSIAAMKKKVWKSFYLNIKGDESAKYDLFAMKFGIFHMNSYTPKHSNNLNIGAKGLTGEGYQGHTYWDTEFFMNPNYLFTDSKVVKKLLEYRYKGIKGARAKALEKKERIEESNLLGAQFPWEMSSPEYGEVCPYWGQADVVTGQQVPIASRRQEIHVSAAVAFAVNQYYHVTNDEKFMINKGYEMIIDTAFFYTNRAEFVNNDKYVIKDVMGPNEYKGNINNNAYTNYLAKYNIELALRVIEKLKNTNLNVLQKILKKIPYEIDVEKMKDVYKKLIQQTPNQDFIIPENDSFLSLPLIDVSPFQMLGDAGKKLFSTIEGHKRLSSQLVKQADVVLLLYLFPKEFSQIVIEKNFEYYEKITTHDSSLSASTYAILAIRLRKMIKAYELFKYSLNIDLGQNMKSSDTGIHAGSLAAIWQVITFGYGGLNWYNDSINLDPIIPDNWEELVYRFKYKNVNLEVSVNNKTFSIKTLNKKQEIFINILDQKTLITFDKKEFEVRK